MIDKAVRFHGSDTCSPKGSKRISYLFRFRHHSRVFAFCRSVASFTIVSKNASISFIGAT